MSNTVQNVNTLKINRLTQEQYNQALADGLIKEDEIYMTPDDNELDTTQFLRVSDEESAVDENPIDADTLAGLTPQEYMTQLEATFIKTTDANNLVSDLSNSTDTKLDAKASLESPTFTGTPKTSANTSYTTAQLRNVILSSEDPTTSDGDNGDIWIKYTN